MMPIGKNISPNVLRSTECIEEKIFFPRVIKSSTEKIIPIKIISFFVMKNGVIKAIREDAT